MYFFNVNYLTCIISYQVRSSSVADYTRKNVWTVHEMLLKLYCRKVGFVLKTIKWRYFSPEKRKFCLKSNWNLWEHKIILRHFKIETVIWELCDSRHDWPLLITSLLFMLHIKLCQSYHTQLIWEQRTKHKRLMFYFENYKSQNNNHSTNQVLCITR